MEKALNSPVPSNEGFFSALRQEDFLTSLCPKSLTNSDKVLKDSDNLSKTTVLQVNFELKKQTDSHCKDINTDNVSTPQSAQDKLDSLSKSSIIHKEQSCDTSSIDSTDISSRPDQPFVKSDQHSACSPKKKVCKSLHEVSCGRYLKNVSLCSASRGYNVPTIALSDGQSCSIANPSSSVSQTLSSKKLERYKKTQDALQGSGLLEITMKTAELIKQNRRLQKDLENFKMEATAFMQNVMNNPENKLYKEVLQISSSNSSKSKQ